MTTIPEVVMYSLERIARLNVVVSPAKNSGAEVVFTIPTSRIVTVVLADTPIAVVVPSATEPPYVPDASAVFSTGVPVGPGRVAAPSASPSGAVISCSPTNAE